jgi:hypothetical protein
MEVPQESKNRTAKNKNPKRQKNKTKTKKLPYNPAIPLFGIKLKEYKSGCNKGTCTTKFIAA